MGSPESEGHCLGGGPQSMVNDDRSAKGPRTILHERGKKTQLPWKPTTCGLCYRITKTSRRKTQLSRTIILKNRGHKVYLLSKFHCELNPIERVWAQAKVYCRAYTNFTLIRLRQIMHPTLDSVTVDNIRKFARKARDYEQAYREGHKAGKAVEDAVKVYKSHRRVFSENI